MGSMIRSCGGACLLLFIMAIVTACGDEQTQDNVRAALPFPAWSFEHWVWEDESTQECRGLVAGYLERDIPVGAIIIDSPWSTGYSTFG